MHYCGVNGADAVPRTSIQMPSRMGGVAGVTPTRIRDINDMQQFDLEPRRLTALSTGLWTDK